MKTAVESTLESSEDARTSRSGLETNIEAHLEGALLSLNIFSEEILTIDLLLTLVDVIKAEEFEGAAGQQKAGGIAGSPVLQTEAARQTVANKLLGISLSKDLVALDGRIGDLSQDIPVGNANDHAILGGAVQHREGEMTLSILNRLVHISDSAEKPFTTTHLNLVLS